MQSRFGFLVLGVAVILLVLFPKFSYAHHAPRIGFEFAYPSLEFEDIGYANAPDIALEAQDNSVQDRKTDSLIVLDSLRAVKERIERFQTVIEKVTFNPTSYNFTTLRAWLIPMADAFNDTLSRYFFDVTDHDSIFIETQGDIHVIATPEPSNDIVAMYFGGSGRELKGQRLREFLHKKNERNMYERILETRNFGEDKELIERSFKLRIPPSTYLIKQSDTVLIAFERYGFDAVDHDSVTIGTIRLFENLRVQFKNEWGFEVKLGNPELGYPSWSSGNMSVSVLFRRLKIGFQIPVAFGTDLPPEVATLFKPRRMNGTYGVVGEFDWAFAGGSFLFGSPRTDTDGTYADPNTIQYIRSSFQLWYSFAFGFSSGSNLMRMKIGVGAYQVAKTQLLKSQIRLVDGTPTQFPAEIIELEPLRFYWSPYWKIDYVNQHSDQRFGASLQYYRGWTLASVWLEIVRNHLRVESSFGTALGREVEIWESPSYFGLSFPITFSL